MQDTRQDGLLIGLTGGIGSGKSTVASIIERTHPVLYTDRIARELMQHNEALREAVVERFGVQAYLSDGSLDRRWLAEVVFGDSRALAELNAIVHPPTLEFVRGEAARLFAGGARVVIVESALIFEAELEEDFDYTVCVLADFDSTVQRLLQRDGTTREQVLERMRHQLPPEEKAGLADFTIHNSGSLDDLEQSTRLILGILAALKPRRS